MKNVLVIVYYFPPMGGSGVQRPLKFVKYLRDYGWNPIVLCPRPGIYPYFDESQEKELQELNVDVHRVDANTLFHIGAGSASSQKQKKIPDFLAKIGRRILRLFLYPDNKKGWIEPAVKRGAQLINEEQIEGIFSSAPPFSNHIIGKELSQKFNLPLTLDYRDAWLHNHFMDGMFGWQKKIMRKMEQECLQEADLVIGLDEFMLAEMSKSYPEIKVQMKVIPHGFDPEDFKVKSSPTLYRAEGKLNFLYSGLFYEGNQPDTFLEGLEQACRLGEVDKKDIHLHFQGGLDRRIRQLLRHKGWEGQYSDLGYQSHQKAAANLKEADILWMISNFSPEHKQVKSGKLFEYFGSRKPVLGLVHAGKEAELLEQYGAGFQAPPDASNAIASTIIRIYKAWETGSLPLPNQAFIQQFDRQKLTGQLAAGFDKISSR